MAKKQALAPPAGKPGGLLQLFGLAFGPWRPLTFGLLALAGFAALILGIWSHVRQAVVQSPQYIITVDQISITPPPPWVPAARAKNIPAEALRLASPADRPLSSLDDDVAQRITDAFTLHPWVAMAKVTKRAPARIMADLIYRRPICVVEVPDDLLPVDASGVLLPSEDFSMLEKQAFPCLAGIETRPLGPPGKAWGDPHVTQGAALAAELLPQWSSDKLYRIRPSAGNHFELVTRAHSQILWGLPPGVNEPGEPTTEDKLRRLQRYVSEHGGLDGPNGPQTFDVRSLKSAEAGGK